ncbi:MAG: 23S rRNA (pseudouridine(1915)-N(3))-methyltransferase RlmH [Firmicutes bacterium]|nr:23S rRNA (pseudouridine(1915)-N(3))-methyltransferase RlmH [Bacillota bacterium]
MKITIACVGKIKEKFYTQAVDEYLKRLSAYANVDIFQVEDEKAPENLSPAQEKQIKDKEAQKLLKGLKGYVIALDIGGKMLDSVELSNFIEDTLSHGASHLTFVIGGSLGLGEEILKRADFKLSFSKMTFPHQLMRVILLEQLYRSQRISHNQPYHK